METLLQQIEECKKEISSFNDGDAESFRIQFLGTKGIIKNLMGEMKQVPNDQKKEFGQLLNALKISAEEKLEALKQQSTFAKDIVDDIDRTLPGKPVNIGTRHPLSIIRSKIISIFSRLGFALAEGPEIEDDWHNFGSMNMPENHPARDMQDTFYVNRNPDWVLRTHTSSVQARVMEKQPPPIRIICPGRVYRNETISARAHCFFHQVEGLCVDENVSFANLKQTLYFFVQEMFGRDVKIRFRPSYFPFTEPSAEMDISCLICGGGESSLTHLDHPYVLFRFISFD